MFFSAVIKTKNITGLFFSMSHAK